MYAIKLDETNRIVAVSYPIYVAKSAVPDYPPEMAEEMVKSFIPDELEEGYILVETLPEDDYHDYLYVDGEYICDPLPVESPAPTQLEVLEAQVTYTAMMTDTLLEV